MLREQKKFYEEYTAKGKLQQDSEYSLSSAIQEQKEIEKKRAELVIAAQQSTLQRIKSKTEFFFKTYCQHYSIFPHVHRRKRRCFNETGKGKE